MRIPVLGLELRLRVPLGMCITADLPYLGENARIEPNGGTGGMMRKKQSTLRCLRFRDNLSNPGACNVIKRTGNIQLDMS